MNKNIKPIPTEYNGTVFRSRLEAQWAVFFDSAHIRWEYESEGFENHRGERYLPDFYLLDFDTYAEVKGERPGYEDEILKILSFVGSERPIRKIVILSSIPDPTVKGLPHFPGYSCDTHGPKLEWYFFHDDGRLSISSSDYPRPKLWACDVDHGFSISAISDINLRSKINYGNKYEKEAEEAYQTYCRKCNFPIYNALGKARAFRWNPPKVKT